MKRKIFKGALLTAASCISFGMALSMPVMAQEQTEETFMYLGEDTDEFNEESGFYGTVETEISDSGYESYTETYDDVTGTQTYEGVYEVYEDDDTYKEETPAATSYDIYVDDMADLLSDEQEVMIRDVMAPIAEKGGVAFVTSENGDGESGAESFYRSYFGTGSGTIFYIDMGARKVCIFSDGEIYESITKSRANEITNSVYRYATDGDYYTCAAEAFKKINSVLKGQFIMRPMRYAHNLFLAIAAASIFLYMAVLGSRYRLTKSLGLKGDRRGEYIMNISDMYFTGMGRKLEAVYHHSSSSGSSGGGGGSSSGGGGSSGF